MPMNPDFFPPSPHFREMNGEPWSTEKLEHMIFRLNNKMSIMMALLKAAHKACDEFGGPEAHAAIKQLRYAIREADIDD